MGDIRYSCSKEDGGRWGDESDAGPNGEFGMCVQIIHKTKRGPDNRKIQTALTMHCPDQHEHEFPGCLEAALARENPDYFKGMVPDLDANGVQKEEVRGTGDFIEDPNDAKKLIEVTETVKLEKKSFKTNAEVATEAMSRMVTVIEAKMAAPVHQTKPLPKKEGRDSDGKKIMVDDAVLDT